MKFNELSSQYDAVSEILSNGKILNALSILQKWINSLKNTEKAKYFHNDVDSIKSNYHYVFQYFLNFEDGSRDEIIDDLIRDTLDLCDNVFANRLVDLNLIEEVSDNLLHTPSHYIFYYSNKLFYSQSDYESLKQNIKSEDPAISFASIFGVGALLFRCFCFPLMKELINTLPAVSNKITRQFFYSIVIFLLARYDDRIDFYPEIQDLFEQKMDREEAYFALRDLFSTSDGNIKDFLAIITNMQDVTIDMSKQNEGGGVQNEKRNKISGNPLQYVLENMLVTWVCDCILDDNDEWRGNIELLEASIGKIGYYTGSMEDIEKLLLARLRSGKAKGYDYINYGHCCLLRDDRVMAVESYKKARSMYDSYEEFISHYEEESTMLIDNKVPPAVLDLIADQLLEI